MIVTVDEVKTHLRIQCEDTDQIFDNRGITQVLRAECV